MKNKRIVSLPLLLVTALLLVGINEIKAQLPSRDNFQFVFENNFENNTIGDYLLTDFQGDWNKQSGTRQSTLDILSENDNTHNKYMRGYFPEGKILPDSCGWLWGSKLPTTYRELYFSYDIRFKPGFEWVLGGKIPGITGGRIVSGVKPAITDGFSARMMWKENGKLVFYVYHQDQDILYGNTYPWGTFTFTSGKWYNLTIRVVINTVKNDVGSNDGILEGFVNGKLLFQKTDLKYRNLESIKIDNMYICSFFGGSSKSWAATRDEWIDTDNFVAYYYSEKASGVPRGNIASSSSKMLIHPYYNFDPNAQMTVPLTPTNLAIASQGQTAVILTWKDNANNEASFEIERSGPNDLTQKKTFSSSVNTVTYNDNGINVAGRYQYRVRAKNTTGNSNWSNTVETTIPEALPQPVTTPNNPPTILDQLFIINESSFSNNYIGKIISTDQDKQQELTFSITSGNVGELFTLNSSTGELKTTTSRIFGPGVHKYELLVKVTDNGSAPQSATAIITVNLVGNSQTVYINPENTDDDLENGSIGHPFDKWSDVTWKEGYSYLQKRGTKAIVDKIIIGANKVTLGAYGEGELPVIKGETTTYLVSGFEKSKITILDLNIQAENALSSLYFLGNSSDSLVIDRCVLTAKSNAIKVVDGVTLVTRYNVITSDHEGIFSAASHNEICYNVFKNCNTAINIMGLEAKAEVYNNVFYDNTKSLSVSYAELTLFNNIFYMTNTGQVAFNHGTGKLTSDNNIYYPEQNGFIIIAKKLFNNLLDVIQEANIDQHSYTSDPKFMDIYSDNFQVVSTSPAINAGKTLKLTNDLTGNSVPVAGITDIGAFEFKGNLDRQIEEITGNEMLLFPNPTSGQLNLMVNLNSKEPIQPDPSDIFPVLRVLDIAGRTLFTKLLEYNDSRIIQDQIDLTSLSNGLYIVAIQFNNEILKGKLTVSK